MNVLLTGASGFVGSHVLDTLLARNIPTTILLRSTSSRRFIEPRLREVEIRAGSLSDAESLQRALDRVTHVIHCAGCTKALRVADYYHFNQTGTRNLVQAVNERADHVERLVHLSSLSAAGPVLPDRPARESDPLKPVSEYGRSKLAAELEVRERCRAQFVILRPPGVYGPRDGDFLRLFKAVKARVLPEFGGGRQPLSLVFVRDLAEAVVGCLSHPTAGGRTYFVASPEMVTARQLGREVAAQLGVSPLVLPLPNAALWLLCALGGLASRLSRRPGILSLPKYPELCAPGWRCDPSALRRELGIECRTTLKPGLGETLAWYRMEGWL